MTTLHDLPENVLSFTMAAFTPQVVFSAVANARGAILTQCISRGGGTLGNPQSQTFECELYDPVTTMPYAVCTYSHIPQLPMMVPPGIAISIATNYGGRSTVGFKLL
jgi:predicted transcriptional regulator